MKLRNKKTGRVVEDSDLGKLLTRYEVPSYDSLKELIEEWEDYTPAEPLIKDEKIRKAVRAWAEANNLSEVFCNIPFLIEGDMGKARMRFEKTVFENLQMGKDYSITELCGSEEIEVLEPTYTTIEEKERLKEQRCES